MKYIFIVSCTPPAPDGRVEFIARTDERAIRFVIWCILGMYERYRVPPKMVADSIQSGMLMKEYHSGAGIGLVDKWKRGQGWVGSYVAPMDKRITS